MKKEYVIRHEDGSFVTISDVSKNNKTFRLDQAFCWSSASSALEYYRMQKAGETLFEKHGDKLYLVGTFYSIELFGLESNLKELDEKFTQEVHVCPDCGWSTQEDNYTRCQACWANGDRVSMDIFIQAEIEREECEKDFQKRLSSSMSIYKITIWNGDEIYPDTEVLLKVACSEEEAREKVSNTALPPNHSITEVELVKEIDGYEISLTYKSS